MKTLTFIVEDHGFGNVSYPTSGLRVDGEPVGPVFSFALEVSTMGMTAKVRLPMTDQGREAAQRLSAFPWVQVELASADVTPSIAPRRPTRWWHLRKWAAWVTRA